MTPAVLLFIQSHDTYYRAERRGKRGLQFRCSARRFLYIPLTEIKVSRSRTIGTVALPATVVEGMISSPIMLASSWHAQPIFIWIPFDHWLSALLHSCVVVRWNRYGFLVWKTATRLAVTVGGDPVDVAA